MRIIRGLKKAQYNNDWGLQQSEGGEMLGEIEISRFLS